MPQIDAMAIKQSITDPKTQASVLSNIIGSRSSEELRAIKAYWPEIGGDQSLADWIKEHTTGPFRDALLAAPNRK